MRYFLVISIHEAHDILLIKGTYVYTFFVVQAVDKISILDYQHPFSLAFVYKIIGQTLLVISCKCVFSVCAKLTVIRRIKKYKVVFTWLNLAKKLFKIPIVYCCPFKMF